MNKPNVKRRSRWWRAYDEALNEPKLQQLPPELFKDWFNLLCLTSENGGTLPDLSAIAFKLRKPPAKMRANLDKLIESGLFDVAEDGTVTPHNWSSRQYETDCSTGRVQRHRENKAKSHNETFHETDVAFHETDVETFQ